MRRLVLLVVMAAALLGSSVVSALPASAHVVPTTTLTLDVGTDSVDGTMTIPTSDLVTASGITDLTQESALDAYVAEHVRVSTDGRAWAVTVGSVTQGSAEQVGTGMFRTVAVRVHLVPRQSGDLRRFVLEDDVVLHQVVTHLILVSVRTDWASGAPETVREVGTIKVDPVTGEVKPLVVDLGAGGTFRGFAGMVTLGVRHILEGTDHQLFLLTLLLPAPLIAAGGAWSARSTPRRAVGKIARITIAFTIGHSITLALGTLGLPIPQQAVEAAIAASIVVAAVHALRPLFPGREVLIAGSFGLVHAMAFSETLTQLHLSGVRLALSLLGFNVGIELMQLVVVVLVLPPLVVLARTDAYVPLRIGAAALTLVAALGWLL